MNYKLIASDLDGTLLYDVFTVSEENFKAIEKYKAMGGQLVPTSGRCFFEIPESLRKCKDLSYCVSSNGAVITELATGRRDEVLIPLDKYDRIMELGKEYDTYPSIHFDGYGYILKIDDDRERAYSYNLNSDYFSHYHRWCRKPESWDGVFEGSQGVEMISLFFKTQKALDECVEKLNALGGLVVTSSAPFNIEIIAEGATKGDGIRRLAKRLGLTMEEVIAVGDSPNDMAMLSAVSLPLAVENAADSLKAMAKKVICSHKDHIVPYILENIIEE